MNKVHRGWLSVRSFVVIEVVMTSKKTFYEVYIIAVMSDIHNQLRNGVCFFFLEKYTHNCMMRSFVIGRLNGSWRSFMNNLHFHICPVSFKLVFTWSIKVNFFSDILEKSFGPWYMYIHVA